MQGRPEGVRWGAGWSVGRAVGCSVRRAVG